MDTTIEWLSTAAAAELLGVQSRTLYRFIDEGRLPAYRFGRVIRVMRSDLQAFVQSCRIEPGTLGDAGGQSAERPVSSTLDQSVPAPSTTVSMASVRT